MLKDLSNAPLDTILEVLPTENVRVHQDFVEAALAMPAELASKLVDKVKTWIPIPYRMFLHMKIGELVSHLAKGGQTDAALDLARALLEVLPSTPKPNEGSATAFISRFEEPKTQIDTWEYGQIIERDFPVLIDKAQVKAFDLICDLLDQATAVFVGQQSANSPEDYSNTWRPLLHGHEVHGRELLRDILISGLVDSATQLAKSDPSQVRSLTERLEARRWLIFHRIALDLLKQYSEDVLDIIESRLTDKTLFDDPSIKNEYADLLQASFTRLPAGRQGIILSWIESGPDLHHYRERAEQSVGRPATDEEVDQYRKIWQRDHLTPIQAYLPTLWKERYQNYVTEFGQPEPRRRSGFVTSLHSPTSPWTTDELRQMSVDEIVGLLDSWTPPDDFFAPSIEDVARVLSEVVAANPQRFAAAVEKFRNLDPTYVRAIISGWRESLKQNLSFDWLSALALCKWVVDQPREISGRIPRRDADANWGETRQRIGELLSAGFEESNGQIPFSLRMEVWRVLEILSDDSEPTPDYESVYGGSNMDPFTLSINTVRGNAMHSVVQYALWVRHNLKAGRGEDAQWFEAMPEVRGVLEKHLNADDEPSLAIHSVYGHYFPWLVLLDRPWAAAHVQDIFPTAEAKIKIWSAAWEAYVVYQQPYNNAVALLNEQYALAVTRLSLPSERQTHPEHPHFRLVEHLMLMYGRGQLSLDPSGVTLSRFWQVAAGALRTHALSFIGRSLANSDDEVPAEIIERFATLWEFRLSFIAQNMTTDYDPSELSAFGSWFISDKFDITWSLQQLYHALQMVGETDPDHSVVEKLAKIAPQFPRESIQCLELLIKGDKNGWKVDLWRESARVVISAALQSSDAHTKTLAGNLVNFLMSRGRYDFRDILQDKT